MEQLQNRLLGSPRAFAILEHYSAREYPEGATNATRRRLESLFETRSVLCEVLERAAQLDDQQVAAWIAADLARLNEENEDAEREIRDGKKRAKEAEYQ